MRSTTLDITWNVTATIPAVFTPEQIAKFCDEWCSKRVAQMKQDYPGVEVLSSLNIHGTY